MRLLAQLSLLLPLLSGVSLANGYGGDRKEVEDGDLRFALTALAYSQDSIYIGGERNNTFLPLPEVYWQSFYFSQGHLGMRAYQQDGLSLDFSLGGDFIGDTERGDSKLLKDMKDLDMAITANVGLSYSQEWGKISFTAAHDISNKHDGYNLGAEYSYRYVVGDWFVEPSVAVTYASEEIVNYYYGVSKSEVTVARPLYQGSEAVNLELGLAAGYVINKNNLIMAFAKIKYFDDEINDSPIVDDNKSVGFGLAYRYSF